MQLKAAFLAILKKHGLRLQQDLKSRNEPPFVVRIGRPDEEIIGPVGYYPKDTTIDATRLALIQDALGLPITPAATRAGRAGKRRKKDPALIVDLRRKTIKLDGMTWHIRSEQVLRWVKVLADRDWEWVSSSQLEKLDPELINVRTDHLRKSLPPELGALLETQPGVGSRLRLGTA
jgi:hypothetical protein